MAGLTPSNDRQSSDSTDQVRKNWFSWSAQGVALLIAFITAVGGAVPQYTKWIKEIQNGWSWGTANQAEEQNRLAERNLHCTAAPVTVKTLTNEAIGVTVCPDFGDIKLYIQPAGKDAIVRWISPDSFDPTSAIALAPSSAFAQTPAAPRPAQVPSAVLCQRRLSDTIILSRVRYPNGQCFDQQINSFTGRVVSQTPAQCSANC